MSKKILFLACLSLILSACGSFVSDGDLSVQVAMTVEANNNLIPATDVPSFTFVAEGESDAPTEVSPGVSTSTPLPLPTATTLPSPTPLPVITDYELINYYYPLRGEIYIEVEIPNFSGPLVGKLNGETLDCDYSDEKATHLFCTGPLDTYYNSTLYLLVPGTEHIALEFVIYLTPYEVFACGADVTGTWTGIDSWNYVVTVMVEQYNCVVTGSVRYSGYGTRFLYGTVYSSIFSYDENWTGCVYHYELVITGDRMEGSMEGDKCDSPTWLYLNKQ